MADKTAAQKLRMGSGMTATLPDAPLGMIERLGVPPDVKLIPE